MKIEANKFYKIRDGRKTIVYAVYDEGRYPIHGAYFDGEEWISCSWKSDGSCPYIISNTIVSEWEEPLSDTCTPQEINDSSLLRLLKRSEKIDQVKTDIIKVLANSLAYYSGEPLSVSANIPQHERFIAFRGLVNAKQLAAMILKEDLK